MLTYAHHETANGFEYGKNGHYLRSLEHTTHIYQCILESTSLPLKDPAETAFHN